MISFCNFIAQGRHVVFSWGRGCTVISWEISMYNLSRHCVRFQLLGSSKPSSHWVISWPATIAASGPDMSKWSKWRVDWWGGSVAEETWPWETCGHRGDLWTSNGFCSTPVSWEKKGPHMGMELKFWAMNGHGQILSPHLWLEHHEGLPLVWATALPPTVRHKRSSKPGSPCRIFSDAKWMIFVNYDTCSIMHMSWHLLLKFMSCQLTCRCSQGDFYFAVTLLLQITGMTGSIFDFSMQLQLDSTSNQKWWLNDVISSVHGQSCFVFEVEQAEVITGWLCPAWTTDKLETSWNLRKQPTNLVVRRHNLVAKLGLKTKHLQ